MSSQKIFPKPSLLLLGESHDRPSTFAALSQNLEHFVSVLNFNVLALEIPAKKTYGNAVDYTKEAVPGTETLEISYEIATQKISRDVTNWLAILFKSKKLLPEDLHNIQDPNTRIKISNFFPRHCTNNTHLEATDIKSLSPETSLPLINFFYSNMLQRLADYYNAYKTNENFSSELLPELINGYKEHSNAYIELLEKAQQLGVTVIGVDMHTREYNNTSQYTEREEHALLCLNNFRKQNPDAGNILMPWGAAHIGNLERLADKDYNASALFIYETRKSELHPNHTEEDIRHLTSRLADATTLEEAKILILKRVETTNEAVIFNTRPLFDKLGLQSPIPTTVNNCTLNMALSPSQVQR